MDKISLLIERKNNTQYLDTTEEKCSDVKSSSSSSNLFAQPPYGVSLNFGNSSLISSDSKLKFKCMQSETKTNSSPDEERKDYSKFDGEFV